MKRFIKYEVNKKVISFGYVDSEYISDIKEFNHLEKSFDTEEEANDYILEFEKGPAYSLIIDPFIEYVRSFYLIKKIEYLDLEDGFDNFSRVLSEDWLVLYNEDTETILTEKMVNIEDEVLNNVVY